MIAFRRRDAVSFDQNVFDRSFARREIICAQLGPQRVLEVNAQHPIFATLKAAQESGDADKVASYASLLYNQALLVEGMPLEDPVAFANEIAKLMK